MRLWRHAAWLLVLLGADARPQSRGDPELRNGDVVLQSQDAAFSQVIRYATRSPYSHVGLVEVAPDGVYVIEAVHTVSRTPWRKWKRRGDGRLTVLRKKALGAAELSRVVQSAKSELGKPYDARFRWDDREMYCSELVYKAFERGAGEPVGQLQRVRSLRLTGLESLIEQRTGQKIPMDQQLVTPASIAEDPRLSVVWSSF